MKAVNVALLPISSTPLALTCVERWLPKPFHFSASMCAALT